VSEPSITLGPLTGTFNYSYMLRVRWRPRGSRRAKAAQRAIRRLKKEWLRDFPEYLALAS
jgi:hypothetical protein